MFSKKIYEQGTGHDKYGIWNDVKKEFQFGICENTPKLARMKLIQKIGDDARKWRFEERVLPKKLRIEYESKTKPDVL